MAQILVYENGNAIGGEGHPTYARDITFENTGTDLEAETAQAAIVEVNAKTSGLTRMTKLWENLSPTASFSAQTITLASDDYNFLLIDLMYANTIAEHTSVIITKGLNALLVVEYTSSTGTVIIRRSATRNSDTVFSISDAKMSVGGGAESTNNTGCIPITIYGIKII